MTDRKTSNISIIIPTLNEGAALDLLLTHLRQFPEAEIIIADGGSIDRTLAIAGSFGAAVVNAPPGRGRQLNRGAEHAAGDVLVFLHCDTLLPRDFAGHVFHVLQIPGTAAGAFRLAIAGRGPGFRLIEWGANTRSGFLQMPYGDQALFMTRQTFNMAGGFPEQPIMEDLALVGRLKRLGRIRLARAAVRTSARRWRQLGLIRTTLVNQIMLAGYLLGIEPQKLYSFYYKMR